MSDEESVTNISAMSIQDEDDTFHSAISDKENILPSGGLKVEEIMDSPISFMSINTKGKAMLASDNSSSDEEGSDNSPSDEEILHRKRRAVPKIQDLSSDSGSTSNFFFPAQQRKRNRNCSFLSSGENSEEEVKSQPPVYEISSDSSDSLVLIKKKNVVIEISDDSEDDHKVSTPASMLYLSSNSNASLESNSSRTDSLLKDEENASNKSLSPSIEESLNKTMQSLKLEDVSISEEESATGVSYDDNEVDPKSAGTQKTTTSLPGPAAICFRPEKTNYYLRALQRQLETMPAVDRDLSETPGWMCVKLLPHQQYGLSWMKWREEQGNGGILADEMGLGKTTSAIALITSFLMNLQNEEFLEKARQKRNDLLKEAISESGRKLRATFSTLVVVPSSVLNQWKQELEDKIGEDYALNVFCHTAAKSKRDKLDDKILRRADVVLTTYDIVKNDVYRKEKTFQGVRLVHNENAALSKIYWKRIILDEAHVIRNGSTQINSAIMTLEAESRWALTGTPVHNKLEDFYSLVRFLRIMPFADRFFWKDKMSEENPTSRNRLNTLVGTILLHRDKSILKLPERVNHVHRINLRGDELKAYNLMLEASQQKVKQLLDEKEGFVPRSTRSQDGPNVFHGGRLVNGKMMMHVILAVLLRLRQAAIHFCLTKEALNMDAFDGILEKHDGDEDLHRSINEMDEDFRRSFNVKNKMYAIFDPETRSKKLATAMKLVREIIDKGEDVVIVSQFVGVLHLLSKYLTEDGITHRTFDGSLKREEKDEVVKAFVKRKEIPVLLLSLAAGGVGLNIQTCANMIVIDPHWNPQLEEQACSRIHRHGQTKAVQIHKLCCDGTIEERVLQLQENKLKLAAGVLSGKAERVNKLTMDDLRFLFALDNRSAEGARVKKIPLQNYDLPSTY